MDRPGTRRRALHALAIGLAAVGMFGSAAAQSQGYPRKPVRLVVAYATGGSIDLSARRISEELAAELGQPVIVENRAGANGVTASEYVARSAPDGHTVLFTTLAAHAGNRWAYRKLPYDTVADFAPVTVMAMAPLVLVAHPAVAANNIAELIRLAKEKPGRVNYASFGVGGLAHLAAVQLNVLGRTSMNHIPYKGGGPAMADVAGGQVDLYFSGVVTALPLIKDGKLKPLAVTGTSRSKSLPDVPTVAETPGFEKFEASLSPIMLMPAKTPTEIVARLQAAVEKVSFTEAHRARLEKAGEGEPRAVSPAQATAMVAQEVDRMGTLFKAAGIEPE